MLRFIGLQIGGRRQLDDGGSKEEARKSRTLADNSTEDVPEPVTDPWSGIGITGETLEAKVDALEKSNAELEANFDAELEEWRKRLENPELIEPESV